MSKRKVLSALMWRGDNKFQILMIYSNLVIATLIAYEPMRNNGFVSLDDDDYIVKNLHVNTGLTLENIKWAFATFYASNWHPLTWLSHMLDCELFGLNPYWHHLINLLLHIMNTMLLFWVLKRTTLLVWPSTIVAVLFALHPMHVESVAWISERKDMLSGLFWMLTMAAYVWYAERPGMGRYIPVFLSFGLGLMAKPMLVTLPFVLLLLDYWPLDRLSIQPPNTVGDGYQKSTTSRIVAEKIPLFILAIGSSVITYIAQKSSGAVESIKVLPLGSRTANALVSYISYITKMVYPVRLAVLYPHPFDSLPIWQPIVCFVLLVVIFISVIYKARQHRHLIVGWLWYVGTLVPVIGLVQVGSNAMADRYSYIPSIGLLVMVGFSGYVVSYKSHYQKFLLGLSTGLVLVVLLLCTRTQVRYWQNSLTLFGHAAGVTKNNYIMLNYGEALLKDGRIDEAVTQFNEVLRVKPDCHMAYNNLGTAMYVKEEFDRAVLYYNKAMSLDPQNAEIHYNLGCALTQQGKLDQAVEQFRKALRLDPGHYNAHNNIAVIMYKNNRIDEAIAHWTEALRLKPDWPEVRSNLDKVVMRKKTGQKDQVEIFK